jgi:hypothetical protein
MLQRAPWNVEADAILHAARQGSVTCATTPLSLANVFYVGRLTVGTDQALVGIRNCLRAFEIVPVDRSTLDDALALPGSDFEDNIEIAAATTATVDMIVTRDSSGFTHSPIPVQSPAEFLQRLQSDNSSAS